MSDVHRWLVRTRVSAATGLPWTPYFGIGSTEQYHYGNAERGSDVRGSAVVADE